MKLAIMQPYFFPYIGYFQLMNAVDQWIVFDVVQYIRHGWIDRNRILHPTSGWQYIIVPKKKHSRDTLIKDVLISREEDWKSRIVAQLNHYKKKAPFFNETIAFVKDCFFSDGANVESLSKFNVFILKNICERLDIRFNYTIFSEMNLELGEIMAPGDWALKISERLGAKEYINPPGGRDIFDPVKFKEKGIQLNFLTPKPITYEQNGYAFVPDLSILDLMMWLPNDKLIGCLNEYEMET